MGKNGRYGRLLVMTFGLAPQGGPHEPVEVHRLSKDNSKILLEMS